MPSNEDTRYLDDDLPPGVHVHPVLGYAVTDDQPVIELSGPVGGSGGRTTDGRIYADIEERIVIVGPPATLASVSAHLLVAVLDVLAAEQ